LPTEVRVHDVVHRVEEEADAGRQGHLPDQVLHGRFGEVARHYRLSIQRTVEEADHLSPCDTAAVAKTKRKTLSNIERLIPAFQNGTISILINSNG
jgi:hypothetical protein